MSKNWPAGRLLPLCCVLALASPEQAFSNVVEPSLRVTLSSRAPDARPALTIQLLQVELQCGQPGATPITITLPAAEKVPNRVALAAITVSGRQAATVTRHRHRITVTPAAQTGITCHVIAPGTLVIRIDKSAKLGNPGRPGRYRIAVDRGSLHLQTSITIGT
jgi:hypothetical protein